MADNLSNLSDSAQRFVVRFREIQLMIKLHREITAIWILQILVFVGVLAGILMLYVLIVMIRNSSFESWPIIVISTQFSIVSVMIFLIALKYFGNVYDASMIGLNRLKRAHKNKWFKLFYHSCPVQRIYFGQTNFFEKETSLNIEQFIVEQTVTLLCMG